jgi:DUF1680 family protein
MLTGAMLIVAVLGQGPERAAVELKRPAVCEPAGQLADRRGHERQAGEIAVEQYVSGIVNQWVVPVEYANPAILAMFRDRDRAPYRNLLPWSGEFAGKHLTGATQIVSLYGASIVPDFPDLRSFVEGLVACQDTDGYLGPFPKAHRLTGWASNVDGKGGPTWDAWGHYHAMIGLLVWHEATGDAKALAAARKIGDLLCDRFLGPDRKPRLVDTGSTEMNLAPAHSLAVLYRKTGEPRYLALARQIVDEEFAAKGPDGKPLAGDYLNLGLSGTPFYRGPKPRWESLHPIMALSELAMITGDERYAKAFETLWWSIAETDIHNHGGFSSGEQAQGNPYHPGAVETCCTVAWMAMTVEMLRLTGEPMAADELELSTYNAGLGAWHPSGAWSTYNTPMDGVRRANYDEIVFQARPGSPQLNCCSVNAPRLIGLLSEWRLMRDAQGLRLNAYETSFLNAEVDGTKVGLDIVGDYPEDPEVVVKVTVSQPAKFALRLRIPHWSSQTKVMVNGSEVEGVRAGSYLALEREWSGDTTIRIGFDFAPRIWVGERECVGKSSIYRGPVLLAYDRRLNRDAEDDPMLDMAAIRGMRPTEADGTIVAMEVVANGRSYRLCDFASAGQDGSLYRSWLKVIDAPAAVPFARERPWRAVGVEASQ